MTLGEGVDLAARPLTVCLERDPDEEGDADNRTRKPNVYRAKKYAAAPIPRTLPTSGHTPTGEPDVKGQMSQLNWIRRLVSKKKRRLQQVCPLRLSVIIIDPHGMAWHGMAWPTHLRSPCCFS